MFFVGITRMAVLYRAGSEHSMWISSSQERLCTDVVIVDCMRDLTWGTIENGLSIICACLPTYRPLLTKSLSIPKDVRAWYSSLRGNRRGWGGGSRSSKSTPSTNANQSGSDSRKRYNKITDGALDGAHQNPVAGDPAASAGVVAGRDFPVNSIQVRNTTEVI